jgi:SNF2 family DNA or RNA helicase
MGAGKSKVTVDTLNAAGHKLVLMIGLHASMIEGLWEKQFAVHSPHHWTIINLKDGTSTDKAEFLKNVLSVRGQERVLVVTNYESAWRKELGALILKTKWDCVVLDEAHHISHPGTKISKFCTNFARKNRSRHRIALTGSPMASSPLGVYSIFKFLDPTVFGTNYSKFMAKYAIMGGFNNHQVIGYRNLDYLRAEIGANSVYVDSDDVLDLPPVMHLDKRFDLEKEARRVYNALQRDMVARLQSGETMTMNNALTKMLRLQQVTGGYFQPDGMDITRISTAKQDALIEVLQDIPRVIVPGKDRFTHAPTVVFARYTEELADIRAAATKLGYRTGEVSGQVKDLAAWNDESIDLIAVQTRAGSESIDLSRARYGIYYSKEQSLGLYDQSMARLHRPGQKHPITFIHLLARATIDVHIDRALAAKADVVGYVLSVFKDPNLTQTEA